MHFEKQNIDATTRDWEQYITFNCIILDSVTHSANCNLHGIMFHVLCEHIYSLVMIGNTMRSLGCPYSCLDHRKDGLHCTMQARKATTVSLSYFSRQVLMWSRRQRWGGGGSQEWVCYSGALNSASELLIISRVTGQLDLVTWQIL